MSQLSSVDVAEKMPDIENTESLMEFLRTARVDREKLEAVEAVLPPALRRGRFRAPDALIASLMTDQHGAPD